MMRQFDGEAEAGLKDLAGMQSTSSTTTGLTLATFALLDDLV